MKPTLFSKHSLYALRFAVLPILTILFGKYLFETLFFDFPLLNNNILNYLSTSHEINYSSIYFYEQKARLLWLSSVLLYFFTCIGFFIFLWSLLKKVASTDLLILVIISSSLSVIEIIYVLNVDPVNSPIISIFRFTFDSLAAANVFSPVKLLIVHYILDFINFFAIIVVPFSILTGCCIVKQNTSDILQLNKQIKLLKEFVEGSSAVMIAGIIHMQLWLYWPLSLMHDFAEINELKNVISAIIQYWGVCYSLTIAALYLPVAIYLRRKVLSNYNSLDFKKNQENSQQLQNSKPFIQSAMSRLPEIVAILGPMLVGSISPAMTNFFYN